MPTDLSPLWISLKTAGIATVITFGLGLAIAYWMWGYQGRWKSLLEGILLSPLILPPTVVGFLLLLLFGKNGAIGQLLLPLNFTVVFTWYAAVISATVVAFPLMYKTALGAFEQIDVNLQRAARTLGASELTVFWRVTLPLALPGILAGTMLAFARALGEFGATLMLAGNIPGQTQTIPMAIYFAVEGGAIQEAWFWSLMILTISLAAITAANLWQSAKQRQGRTRQTAVRQLHALAPAPIPKPVTPYLSVDIQKNLPDFSLQVCFTTDDRTLGLLGASGAGKSLILRCIAGIETPDAGQIVLNGRVLFDAAAGINLPSRDRHVGFLFQNYALFPHLTVAQNIAFGLPKTTPAIAKQQVAAQLAAMQLEGLSDRYPQQLSGGQQQRVALARALASQPAALLLDEPFSALDTHLRYQIEQLVLATLKTYAGISLFVSHNLEEAYRICNDLLVLDRGRAIAFDSKQTIFEHPQTVDVAQLTGCKNFSRAVAAGANQIEAIDWGCALTCIEPLPDSLTQVGIRAHQIKFLTGDSSANSENTFPCWLAATSETPHRITLYLTLNHPPTQPSDYHLQAEVFKERWATLKDQPFPWQVQLEPLRLILLV
ncbi:molybdate ABC transporter permease subunit [Phormidium tenue FACHB-886]|nr:molybdate ABC transporter permease subunit [Phormidium tenue FACHB-886]